MPRFDTGKSDVRVCVFPPRLPPVVGRGFVGIRGRQRAGALRWLCRSGCGQWSLQCNLHGAVSRLSCAVGGGAVRGAEGRHFVRVEERKLRTSQDLNTGTSFEAQRLISPSQRNHG